MNLVNRLRRWCPQSKMTLPTNHTRVSKSETVFALAMALEILLLLVVPLTYYVLLAPKPEIVIDQKIPLTNAQIRASWPNLPTAAEIVKNASSLPYIGVPSSSPVSDQIINCTTLNVPNYGTGGLFPKQYDIWLNWTDGWIQVPPAYLKTANPPVIPSEQNGFLGSGLPLEYIVIALLVILTTAIVGINLIVRKRNPFPKTT